MGALPRKLVAALASASLTCAAIFAFFEERPRQEVIAFTGHEGPALGPLEWAPTLDPSAQAGISVLDAPRSIFPPSAFVREPIRAQVLGEESPGMVPDPHVHYRAPPYLSQRRDWDEHPDGQWTMRTNSLGLREDDEPLPGVLDLRILITGDSHTDGVCHNREAFGNLLEARLRHEHPGRAIETLNAARGGYSFYHYLGTLERFLYLAPDVFVIGVYGGNDFENVLTLFHEHNGSERPPGNRLYGDLIARAAQINKPSMAQAMLSLKYFDVHPDQMEVALQAARDVTTEIVVTCLRHSVHPIFVYIPGMPSVEWEAHAEVFEAVAAALEITPEGLLSTDRMADSYLAFLRERRLDVIDMREVFRRAGPGNFWLTDHHINLRGQQLIADELHPLVTAARPLEAVRARRAPVSDLAKLGHALLSPGSAASASASASRPGDGGGDAGDPARVFRDQQLVVKLFGEPPHTVYDPLAGYRYDAHLSISSAALGLAEEPFTFITNEQGLREDEELPGQVDLRVVVTGDEQVAGACSNPLTFSNLAEAELRRRHPGTRIDVVNAGVAGYSFQNYLGMLERSLPLDPDIFVMVVSSGTDFLDGLRVDSLASDRKFARRLDDYAKQLSAARAISAGAVDQAFGSVKHFRVHRPQGLQAYEVALDTTRAMLRICEENDIELAVIHLPAAPDVEWDTHLRTFARTREALKLDREQLNANLLLADRYLGEVRRLGIDVVRLEQALAEADGPLYRPSDFLIDSTAQGVIAAVLVEHVERVGALHDGN